VFGSSIQGRGVYVINLDGTGLRKVVATTGGYENPAWSPVPAPDGRFKIAYLDLPGPPDGTIEGGNQDLFLVNPDGTGRVNVTNTRELHERYPTWSPSATRVAAFVEKYTVAEPGVPVGLFVYDLGLAGDGGVTITGQTNLTASGPLSTAYLVIRPDWARTQDRIAVVVLETGSSRWDIWRIDLADPTNPVNITRTPTVGEHMPSWSPDDSRIAYQRNNSKNRLSIFVMNADGSSATDIGQPARGLAGQSYPSWRRGSE
jgi:Tol biopolymer transport system component